MPAVFLVGLVFPLINIAMSLRATPTFNKILCQSRYPKKTQHPRRPNLHG